MVNRIWFQLEKPETAEEGKERAALLSQMLGRLGVEFGRHPAVFWSERDANYAFTTDTAGNYDVCEGPKPGRWFSLDGLATGQ